MNQIYLMMRFLEAKEVYEWASDDELTEAGQDRAPGTHCRYAIHEYTDLIHLFETFEQWSNKSTSVVVETIPPTVRKRIHARLYAACKTAMTPIAMAMLVRGELQKIGITGKLDE